MIQRTLAQVRPELTQVSGVTGLSLTDSRFVSRLNNAIMELMNEADLPGVVDRYHVRYDQASGVVALPYFLDRMISATVDHVPTTIASPWFEFVGFGPGYQDDFDARGNRRYHWVDVITDRGDYPTKKIIPVEAADLTGPWVLRVYPSVDEDVAGDPPTINIQGLDTDGLAIRTQDGTSDSYYNGVDVEISLPFVATTQQFSKITGVVKPETRSFVKLVAWNGVVEVELANYAYNETTPSYRHYYVPRLHNRNVNGTARDHVLLARCRKRFVPVAADTDILIISNPIALSEMIIAQWKRTAGNMDEYAVHKQTAVDILKKEAMGYLGKARVPAISFTRGYPIGAFPGVR